VAEQLLASQEGLSSMQLAGSVRELSKYNYLEHHIDFKTY
jgi:hypothetical protein